jgi:hypothetical protein
MRKILLTCVLLTGCTTLSIPDFDEGDRIAHREAMEEWCRYVAVAETRTLCIKDAKGDWMPGPSAPALPEYTEACGYLPPLLGDDC